MSVIIILISVSLLVAIGFVVAFFWSVNDGQYEDDYAPSVRILFDNDIKHINSESLQTPEKPL